MERSPWEHRLGRTLRVFLLLLAGSGIHRLAIVPLVEPRLAGDVGALEPTAEESAAIRVRAESRMAAIGSMFPAGSWERDSPIVLESHDVRLLFKQYHSLPDGRVNLVPCTLVLFPDKRSDGDGRTIVMRSPQGAVLEFAEPLDLRQGKLSKLVGGSLRGQISVRGSESSPGAEDDIEIVSRDLQLRGLELRSTEPVQFRYGRSTGGGQGIVITLLPKSDQPARPSRRGESSVGDASIGGPNVGGIDSVRLERDVQLQLEGIGDGMMPSMEPSGRATGDPVPDRVRVTSSGPMTFHPNAGILQLEDRVEVVRYVMGNAASPPGEVSTDELTCEALTLALGGGDHAAGQAADERQGSPRMTVREIEARGAPAVARSRSAGLEARAGRIGFEVSSRRILLDGGQRVSLSARGLEMEAAAIDYVPDPPVQGGRPGPGTLLAAGPGWIRTGRGRVVAETPEEREGAAYAVSFKEWLRGRPDGEGYCTSVTGDADVRVEGQGHLAAAELHLWMESDPAVASQTVDQEGPPGLAGLRPARMLARGSVDVDSLQLAARADRLELWFRHDEPVAAAVTTAAATGRASSAGSPTAVPRVPSVATSPGAVSPSNPPPTATTATAPRRPTAPFETDRGRFVVSSSLVRGLVVVKGEQQELDEMSLEGQVHLEEQPANPADGQPISIRGDQMQVTRPVRSDARAVVSGSPAHVKGRDLELDGPLVEFDRGRNRVAVDGAGRLTLPVPEGGGLDQIGISTTPRTLGSPREAASDRLAVEW
ncbi:MAG: hypothetical protein ACKOCN_04545, partial [Planctomycetaceae bacterium]